MEVVDTDLVMNTMVGVVNQEVMSVSLPMQRLRKVEDTEVMDPDHPRVASQNDADVKVHMIQSIPRLVSLMPKQVTENMVLAAAENRVRDRQRAAAHQRAARDQVGMVVMAAAREVVRAARGRVTMDMVVPMMDIVLGICVS